MDKKIPLIIAAVSLVIAAGGITFGIKANNEKKAALEQLTNMTVALPAANPERPEADQPLVELKEIASSGPNNVAELQEQLAARDAELARLRGMVENRRNRQNQQDRPSFQDRMAQMKEEDPERYAEMIQRTTERAEQMRYDQANRLAMFMDMDTSGMNEQELANHTALLEKLSALWDATGEFDPENPPDRETMREVFGSLREIGSLMDQERTVMFKQLGSEVGLSGTEAEEFASYVESIIDSTSMRPPRGMRGGGR